MVADKKKKFKCKEANEFYQNVIENYSLEDHHEKLLMEASYCLDRIHAARMQVEKDGMYSKDRYGGTKPHPGLKEEKDNRLLFCKLLRELNLQASAEDSRPPRIPY